MHFSGRTFLAPYLHQSSAMVQIMHYIGYFFGQKCIRFGANLAAKFKYVCRHCTFFKALKKKALVSWVGAVKALEVFY